MAFYVTNSVALWGEDFNPLLYTPRELEEKIDAALESYNKAFKPPSKGLGGALVIVAIAVAVACYATMGPAAGPAVAEMTASAAGPAAVPAVEAAAATALAEGAAASSPGLLSTVTGAASAAGSAAISSPAVKALAMQEISRQLNKAGAPRRDAQTDAALSALVDQRLGQVQKAAAPANIAHVALAAGALALAAFI